MSDHQSSHRKFRVEDKCRAVLRILAGEQVEQLANELGTSAARVARWQSRFVAAGRDALAKDEAESHHSQGFLKKHRKAILQWATLAFLLIAILATLTRIAASNEP